MTRILDAHVHFWDPSARRHDWLAEEPRLRRRFGPEDLDPGHHELAGAVFVQADCRDEEALDEVRWVEQLAVEHRFIRGVVAYAPVHKGRAAEPRLVELASRPLVVGVRRLLQGRPPAEVTDPWLVRGVRMLAEWGLTFDLCVTHEQLPAVAELVRACPDTVFILDHLGKPPVAARRLDPWREDLARIAAHPNVSCKLSGLATEAAPEWDPDHVRPYLEHALEVFGPARCMIGSDWPVATLRTSLERWFDIVLDVIAELAPAERAAVLGGTAANIYGLAEAPRTEGVDGDARRAVRR
jgi:predicted TIM-barrel fold metal-dependent hydrolase